MIINGNDTNYSTTSTEDFSIQLARINGHTTEEQKKSVHYKSLRNFIYHYSDFKKNKISAANLIMEYLSIIEQNNFSFTEEQSKGAYDLYITPLARIYNRQLNFSSEFSILSMLLFYCIPNLFLWMLSHSKVLIFSLIPLYLFYWIMYVRKYLQKKIYGYRY
jgi:hypothetical protein